MLIKKYAHIIPLRALIIKKHNHNINNKTLKTPHSQHSQV